MTSPAEDAKVMSAYKDEITSAVGKNIDDNMCWIVDWIQQTAPPENKFGTAMEEAIYYTTPLENGNTHLDHTGQPPKAAQNVLVFSDNYGFCKGILDHAPQGRVGQKQIVSNKDISKLGRKELKKILTSSKWDLIIFAFGLDEPPTSSIQDIFKHQDDIIKCFLAFVQEVANLDNQPKGVAVLTADHFAHEKEIHEECGLGLISTSLLFGMINTVRQEIPGCAWAYIDTEWALREESFPMLSSEVFREETLGYEAVRVLNSGRHVLRIVPAPKYEPRNFDFVMPSSGLIALSGGNGALGLVFGNWFLDTAKKQGKSGFKMEFLSRSTKVTELNMPLWKTIQDKAASMGVEVEQAKLDCSIQEDVDKYVAKNASTLYGFVHTTGVLADQMIGNLTWEL